MPRIVTIDVRGHHTCSVVNFVSICIISESGMIELSFHLFKKGSMVYVYYLEQNIFC